MLNKVQIIGRLGSDPESKTLSNGQTVVNMSVATSEKWLDRDGQKQERTEWHRVVVYGKPAEAAAKYLSKGRLVYVEGKLQTRSWEDQGGVKRYSTEVVASGVKFLESNNNRTQDSHPQENFEQPHDYDDIPF